MHELGLLFGLPYKCLVYMDLTSSVYVGMVPGYGEAGVCMALASVEGMTAGGDSPVRP